MRILFCCNPLSPRAVDPDFEREAEAAAAAGLQTALLDFEALTNEGDAAKAVRRVPPAAGLTVYRGWMLRPAQYARLFEALQAKGLSLINTPEQYRRCHYLPESYPFLAGRTPRSVWLPVPEPPGAGSPAFERLVDEAMALLRPFGTGPVLLKDYVKSRKHEWEEACYIPSAADRDSVSRVVRRFLELQGDDLNEGLVFREYVPLAPAGIHPQSGMPLSREYRIFWLDGEPAFTTRYWEDAAYGAEEAPVEQFRSLAAGVGSRFFTMDLAQSAAGEWLVIELGDGQVSGIPEDTDPAPLYHALAQALP